jgi:hypothetical protein
VARSASLERSPWLPSYAWWAPPEEYALTVVLSSFHSTTQAEGEFEAYLRGLAGSGEALWEHETGPYRHGDEVAVELDSLDLPAPPSPTGGVIEVHVIRTDRAPERTVDCLGQWVHAEGRDGGGYLIPTIPIRGQEKRVQRDDLQVFPGVMSDRGVETEIVLLNPIDVPTQAHITVSSAGGLVLDTEPFQIGPWSAWRGSLSNELPRVRRMLAEDGGIGSAAVYSSHKILPFFGFRSPGLALTCMDHGAPMFV